MESMMNGKTTYAMLQRLLERAWDEADMTRAAQLSRTIDEISARIAAMQEIPALMNVQG